jgi:RNA polymerase sigma factor (sigma-70 family)
MYESMIRCIANKYGLAADKDCLQEARIFLWYQLPKFNPQLGMKKSTYAWQQIQFGIKNYLSRKQPVEPSIDAPLRDGTPWIDTIPSEPARMYTDLYRALQKLEPKEKGLIHEYFFLGRTLQEIGNSRQCTREWTRRKIEKILKKLRRYL